MAGSEPRIITKDDYEGTMDDSYVESLNELLIGDYHVSGTMWFGFEPDGVIYTDIGSAECCFKI